MRVAADADRDGGGVMVNLLLGFGLIVILLTLGTVAIGFMVGLWQERAHLRLIRRANRYEEPRSSHSSLPDLPIFPATVNGSQIGDIPESLRIVLSQMDRGLYLQASLGQQRMMAGSLQNAASLGRPPLSSLGCLGQQTASPYSLAEAFGLGRLI